MHEVTLILIQAALAPDTPHRLRVAAVARFIGVDVAKIADYVDGEDVPPWAWRAGPPAGHAAWHWRPETRTVSELPPLQLQVASPQTHTAQSTNGRTNKPVRIRDRPFNRRVAGATKPQEGR